MQETKKLRENTQLQNQSERSKPEEEETESTNLKSY